MKMKWQKYWIHMHDYEEWWRWKKLKFKCKILKLVIAGLFTQLPKIQCGFRKEIKLDVNPVDKYVRQSGGLKSIIRDEDSLSEKSGRLIFGSGIIKGLGRIDEKFR